MRRIASQGCQGCFEEQAAPLCTRPLCIAGPCSAETEAQVMETARGLADAGVRIFRAGLWKPRTRPGSFEGVGSRGLAWLRRVKAETGMPVCTEVASEKHVRECLEAGVDMLWIGARTSANPFLVQEIADALDGADVPVWVKNPVNPDLGLWIGAVERLSGAGIRHIGVIHRGVSPASPLPYRNDPAWEMAVEMRSRFPHLPFLADPSHMGGDRRFLRELSQRALDLGLDGLMIESHCAPDDAWSDAAQQITPEALRQLLSSLTVRESHSDDAGYRDGIDALRARIDLIDENLLKLLKERMDASRSIGRYKKNHKVAILQTARWESLLRDRVERGAALGLSEAAVTALMRAIHEESVRVQTKECFTD